MKTPVKITPEILEKIITLYKEGKGGEAIAKETGLHPNSVRRCLKQNNVEVRGLKKKITDEDEKEIVRLYKEGMSAPKVAEKYNLSPAMVRKYVLKAGDDMRCAEEAHRKYAINEDFFDVIDTQEKAYLLGFIFADGCNQIDANYVRIEVAQKDKDILEKFSKLIYLNEPLDRIFYTERSKKLNGAEESSEYYHCHLNINSKRICKVLEKLGCIARKSLTVKFPESIICPELQRHFIRGYYDGDGGTWVSKENDKHAATCKILGTFEFCHAMIEIIFNQTGLKFSEPYRQPSHSHINMYSINKAGNRTVCEFLDWLYKDAFIYLDRKFENYQRLLRKNIYTNELIEAGTQGYSKSILDKYPPKQ